MKENNHQLVKSSAILNILSFIPIAIISSILMYHTHVLFNGNDIQFHLRRMLELKESISHGDLLPIFGFNYFRSFPVMGLYPYFILLPLIILFSLTSSYVLSYNLFFILITFISLVVSYFSSLKSSKSIKISYLFAVIFSLSSAFLIDFFYDGDLGLATSLVFLPLVIFGFMDILYRSNKYLKLTLGVFLMSICQLPAVLVVIGFLIFWLLVNFKRINKILLITLFKSGILSLLLTSIIWIPMMKLAFTNKMSTPGVVNGTLRPSNLLGIVKNIGIVSFIFLFIILLCFKELNKFYKQMYLISILLVILSSRLILFLPVGFLSKFQFTSRFLIIPQIFLSYLSAYLIAKFLDNHSIGCKKLGLVSITGLVIVCQLFSQMYLIHKDYNSPYKLGDSYKAVKMYGPVHHYCLIKDNWIKYFANGYMDNDDYSTIASKSKYKYINNNEATYDDNRVVHVKHNGYNRFSFNNPKKIHHLALPLLHYNGERLRVNVNRHSVHYHVNRNSLITLSNVKKGRNVVSVKYVPNMWLVALKCVLFMIGIVWIIYDSFQGIFLRCRLFLSNKLNKIRNNNKIQNIILKLFNVYYGISIVIIVIIIYISFNLGLIIWELDKYSKIYKKNIPDSEGVAVVKLAIKYSFLGSLILFILITGIYFIILYLKKSAHISRYILKKQENVIPKNAMYLLGEYTLVNDIVGNNVHTLVYSTMLGISVEAIIYTLETIGTINHQKILQEEYDKKHKKYSNIENKLNDIFACVRRRN